jgi:thiamine monophosphate synthase
LDSPEADLILWLPEDIVSGGDGGATEADDRVAEECDRLIETGRLAAVITRNRNLRERCRGRVACFADGDPDLARSLDSDGVLLHDAGMVARSRELLGKGALIGMLAGLSRHDAMVAGEAGADYVLFGQRDSLGERTDDLVAWAADLTTLPVAAVGPVERADGERLLAAGASMLVPTGANVEEILARLRALAGLPAPSRETGKDRDED